MIFSQKVINYLFALLVVITPLLFLPFTSEVFEFNKMITVYIFTVLICGAWLARMIIAKKIIFRRTILDIPLLIFLLSQVVSASFSIDPRTSLLGYYSRFNGGVWSLVSYSLLYWAFVANMNREKTLKTIAYCLVPSALIISVYAILEHFGFSISCLIVRGEFNTNCWVQDVKTRVFATLGQPNWLAAYLAALIPLVWANVLNSKFKVPTFATASAGRQNFWFWSVVSCLFFITLLFTKSRSGLLGFLTADVIFWTFIFLTTKFSFLKHFLILNSLFVILALVVGTPWSTGIKQNELPTQSESVLERGGTESGEIRKIVWKGAMDIWRHNLLFGTGPETFAFSYYQFKPREHNLTSEWDFLYNKAHNEYLNYLANTGLFGLLTYLILIGVIIYLFLEYKSQKSKVKNASKNLKLSQENFLVLDCNFELCILNFAFLAGFASILITNFFGFSVVVTNLLFFLFPAFGVVLVQNDKLKVTSQTKINLNMTQKITIFFFLLLTSYFLLAIFRYWYADFAYEKGKQSLDRDLKSSIIYLSKAIEISPDEAIFHAKLAEGYSKTGIKELTDFTFREIDKAISLSPYNLNIKRVKYNILLELSQTDKKYGLQTIPLLMQIASLAPTDAKINYNLGISYERVGQSTQAIEVLRKVVDLKPNYRNARLALALIYEKEGQKDKAKQELKYILEKIDPNDSIVKAQLEKLK